MIIHLFNSSSVSGPERLVLPALARFPGRFMVVNLREERIERPEGGDPLEDLSRSLGLRYGSIPVRGRWDRAAMDELQALLEDAGPALVHAHDVKASLYLLRSNDRKRRDFPLLTTHHGIHGRPDLKTRLYELLYRRYLLRSFDRVLCVSTADHEALAESGVGAEKLRLHLNGSDGRLVRPEERREASRETRALLLPGEAAPDSLFLVGVVGRLSAEKDHARLFHVLSHLARRPPAREWRCLVFGAGPLEESLRALVRRLGLEGKVLWMGYRKGVRDEIAGLDLLLSFSKAEGLPINLIEAGWAGTPVMATKVGGVTDLIPDERFGTLVPIDEPVPETGRRLAELLSEAGEAKRLAQAGRFQRHVVDNFTQKRWIRRLDEIYSELDAGFQQRPEPAPAGTAEHKGGKVATAR